MISMCYVSKHVIFMIKASCFSVLILWMIWFLVRQPNSYTYLSFIRIVSRQNDRYWAPEKRCWVTEQSLQSSTQKRRPYCNLHQCSYWFLLLRANRQWWVVSLHTSSALLDWSRTPCPQRQDDLHARRCSITLESGGQTVAWQEVLRPMDGPRRACAMASRSTRSYSMWPFLMGLLKSKSTQLV